MVVMACEVSDVASARQLTHQRVTQRRPSMLIARIIIKLCHQRKRNNSRLMALSTRRGISSAENVRRKMETRLTQPKA